MQNRTHFKEYTGDRADYLSARIVLFDQVSDVIKANGIGLVYVTTWTGASPLKPAAV
jgi:hypothetical protein